MECDYNPTLKEKCPKRKVDSVHTLNSTTFQHFWPSIHALTKGKESIEGINPMIKDECTYWASMGQFRVAVVKDKVVGTFRRVHTSDREEIEEVLRTVHNCRLIPGCGGKDPEDYQMFDWKDGRIINGGRKRGPLRIEFGTDLFGFGDGLYLHEDYRALSNRLALCGGIEDMITKHKIRDGMTDYAAFKRFVFGFAVSDDAYGERGAGFNIFLIQNWSRTLSKHFNKEFSHLQVDSWRCENHYFKGHTFRYYFVAALYSDFVSKL